MSETDLFRSAFFLYSVFVVVLGYRAWWAARREGEPQGTESFWSADRSLSGWSTGLSMSASMMSVSWSCVYCVQLYYWYGMGAAWLLSIPWLVTTIGFVALAPRFRKRRLFSQPELLGQRFGPGCRQMLAPILALVFIVWGGAEIYAAGIILAPLLGLTPTATQLLVSVVIALYTYTGGFRAVVSTDKAQFLLVAGFISIIAFTAVMAAGGMSFLTSIEPVGHNLFSANELAPRAIAGTPWYFSPGLPLIILTFFAYLPGWLVETDMWIRLQATNSDREAQFAACIASFNGVIFVGLLPMLIGLAALALYPPIDTNIPARLDNAQAIFSVIMQDHLPFWLNLCLGIALAAAAMSTVDTCCNVVALSTSYDLLEPRLKNHWTPSQLKRLARSVSVATIALAFVYALFTDSLWDVFYLTSGILTASVAIPVMGSLMKKTRALQVKLAMGCGFIATLVFYYLESLGLLDSLRPPDMPADPLIFIAIGLLCSFLGFIVGDWRRFLLPGRRPNSGAD